MSPQSPGKAVQQAALSATRERTVQGGIEILSDTLGVDFGPYIKPLVERVRTNWYKLIPVSAEQQAGKLAIEFSISSAGRITDMRLVTTSGDASLDRPAWEAIRLSDPLHSLPSGFAGDFVTFRFRFYYNPVLGVLDGDSEGHARLKHKLRQSDLPKYPDLALASKIDGIVRLEANVQADGKVKTVKVLEGDTTLAEPSADAVRRWRFHAAKMNGRAVAETVRIKLEFRLEGERVRAEVVYPEQRGSR